MDPATAFEEPRWLGDGRRIVVAGTMLRYPELLGVVLAGQVVLGRYTGYRLSELYRFRDFTAAPAGADEGAVVVHERLPLRRF